MATFEDEFKEAFLHRKRYFNAIGRYVADYSSYDDVSQNAFLRAWAARHMFRGESKFSTWLTRVSINAAINYSIGSKYSNYVPFDETTLYPGLTHQKLEDEVLLDEQIKILNKGIMSLPDVLRNTFVLRFIYDFKYWEISQSLNIPIGTVRSHIHRARMLLKKQLS